MRMDSVLLCASVQRDVQRRFSDQAAGHGFDHVLRVLATARTLAAESGGDLLIIELAALLHDVGDAKFHGGVDCSAEFARQILGQYQLPQALIEPVVHIVDNLSFRRRHTAEPLSLEGQIVQDADRLDALGAIGIVRCIQYSASCGQPFYDPDQPLAPSGLRHFYDKLFQLSQLMNTPLARRLAQEREALMRTFVTQYLAELKRGLTPGHELATTPLV